MNTQNRWLIAAAGVLMQIAFGAVYAWSVFRIPLSHAHGWTIAEVTVAFEIAIFVVGFAAFAGGLWMKRSGPRPVGIAAAILYGLGTKLTGTSHDLTTLYLTYGVIGGAGLGLGYIVPIATLVRWFPDKRGMITGLAVAGFGAGALVTAPANSLIASVGVGGTFEILILQCYGGGFGTMPAFATDYFGAAQIGSIYGLMLTAWGCAAVFGPSLVAGIRQATGHYQGAMRWLALATLVSAVVPLLLRPAAGAAFA